MAEYRFEAQMISRAAGRSATAAAAYRAGDCIEDARTGVVHDYTRKGGVAHSEIMAPETAPGWVYDREKLWNAVEKSETRINSQVAREVLLSLPHELTHEQRVGLVRDFVQGNFVARGMVADVSIHEPSKGGDGRNHHAHIMLTTREIGAGVEGFTVKNRDWNAKDLLQTWRENWAQTQNRHLVQALGKGAPQLTHKSYAEQGLSKLPGRHLGPSATAIERRGEPSFRAKSMARQAEAVAMLVGQGERRLGACEAVLAPPGRKNLGELDMEMQTLLPKLKGQKAGLETQLFDIQEQLKEARRKSASAIRQHSLAPYEKAEFEARRELERREQEARAGQGLDAKTIMRWVTNPAEMLWKAAKEQMAQGAVANAGGQLKAARADKKVVAAWLQSDAGREFTRQKLAEIRAASPEMFGAVERLNKAGKAKRAFQKATKSPEGKEIIANQVKKLQGDLTGLRAEERKVRRHLARINRNIGGAGQMAKLARNLYENGLGGDIKVPGAMVDPSRYLRAVQGELESVVRGLKPEQQQALALNFRRVISLGLGG